MQQLTATIHPKRRRRALGLVLLALLAVPCLHGGGAEAARIRSLDQVMHMRIEKVKGQHVTARGSSTGTVSGTGSFHLVLSNGSHATATFSGHNPHGTISGTGEADYRVVGAISYYNGRITSLHGTGRYAHAASLGIALSGTVNRRTHEVEMHLRGKWHV